MSIFKILEYACWVGSALALLWMFVDFLKTNIAYDEGFLISSIEGYDEISEQEKLAAKELDQD